jgi:tetratricopeptide (TPR) repeat protein
MDPGHPKIEVFHKQIRMGVTPPSQSQAQEIIRRNDAQELFRLAEQCLCFGKTQVGQKILMHLLQREAQEAQAENTAHVPNPYIQRLLWAHKGDFTSSISLNGLLNQVSYPDDGEGGYEATVSLTELTSSTAQSSTSMSHSPFAGLFKGEETQVTMAELTAEVTSAFVFTDRENDSTQRVDAFLDEDKGTVAIDVIQEIPEVDMFEATGAFDKSMFYKESNDDEVVVLLSGEAQTSEIPKHMLQAVQGNVQVEVVAKVPEVDQELAKRYEVEKAEEERRRSNDSKRVVQGAIFAVVILLIVALLAMWGIRTVAAQNLLSRSTPILLSADPQQIGKLKTQLELQQDKVWLSQQVHTEFLALASYVYWRDFSGDQSFYDEAIDILDGIPELNMGWVAKLTQAFIHMDAGELKKAEMLLTQIHDEEHDLVKWVRLELNLQKESDSVWDPEIMEYPRVLVTAIEADAMVPMIESQNAWIQLVSLQQELGHISVDDATVILNELQDNQWQLGSAQQAMLFLLQSLYQDKQQSPKSRLLRRRAYEADPDNAAVQFWLGLDYFWANEPLEAMKLWEKCLGEYSGCASGYAFIGKEFAMDVEVLEVLAGIPEHRVDKGALKAYIQNSPENHLTHFWTTQSVDSEDAFWVQLINQRTEWIGGQEDSGSVWYLAWKAQSEFNAGHAKYAYQWGLSAIQIFPKYTRMYELLAESAKLLGRDPRPFWTQYLQQDPKTSRLAEARKAVEG